MRRNIAIIGAGGQGKETLFYVRQINQIDKKFDQILFFDDNKNLHGKFINGIKVAGDIDHLLEYYGKNWYCVIALGNPKVKLEVKKKIEKIGLPFENIISPLAVIDFDTIELGTDNIIAPGVKILPDVKIGNHVLINYNSVIGHDCKLEDYVTIAPSVGIAGNVEVKKGSKIGIGASIIQNLKIGSWSMIGAGAAVIRDVPEQTLVVGVPAKEKKRNGQQ
ncbi:MAG: acetyltransferase [Candidatus Heimdallarchaeum endolithica]|uniref:Acetyltransferase n=1 Tax=Candidatus Heimdallarchaeum endolithica TaxID=2876572 RepID=A0A9Y1FPN7_9ARCH|nr:MAG: acetyltransferase [Candidatus Heimdallarchaeum endolithica]